MGRPKRHSGGYAIQHAEELFMQSVEAGKPDYSYVALAIGSAPGSPPLWAVLECIGHRCDIEMKVARGQANVSAFLDEVIRLLDKTQHQFWLQTGGDGPRDRLKYDPPSLRSAIIQVAKNLERWTDYVGSANDDWMKPIREAWDWEQKHDLAQAVEGELLDGFETTSRINRVIMHSVAAERGDPEDTARWAWIAKVMIEQQRREPQ